MVIKKSLISLLVIVGIFLCGMGSACPEQTVANGDVCEIYNWSGLNNMRLNLTGNYVLTNNLDDELADWDGLGNNWDPVGNLTNPFNGSFNGRGHMIHSLGINSSLGDGLYCESSECFSHNLGLFGVSYGNITNLEGPYLSSLLGGAWGESFNVSHLVGLNYGRMENIYMDGGLFGHGVLGMNGIGGFCGANFGVIDDVSAYMDYMDGCLESTNANYMGGVVGNNYGLINNAKIWHFCFDDLINDVAVVGGIAGLNDGIINNSYVENFNVLTAMADVGGIAGINGGIIQNSEVFFGGQEEVLRVRDDGSVFGFSNGGTVIDSSFIYDYNRLAPNVWKSNISMRDMRGHLGFLKANTLINTNVRLNTYYGVIDFINTSVYSSVNNTNFFDFFSMGRNSAWVSPDVVLGNNKSKVTIYNVSVSGIPTVLRNGTSCPYNICSNLVANGNDYTFVIFSWDNSNFSIGDSPLVYLFSVENSTSTSRTFTYNISDDSEIANCKLYINNEEESGNITAVNKSSQNNELYFSPLGVGTYVSYISCTDQYGNVGNSSNITFQVTSVPAEETETTSGGGGTYSLTESALDKGLTRNVWKGVVWKFNAGEENHTITFNNVSSDILIFTVASSPRIFNVKINKSVLIDVEEDGVYDLNITYNKYYGRLANVEVKAVSIDYGEEKTQIEEGNTQTEVIIESESYWDWAIGIVIVALIIVGLVLVNRRVKHKRLSAKNDRKK